MTTAILVMAASWGYWLGAWTMSAGSVLRDKVRKGENTSSSRPLAYVLLFGLAAALVGAITGPVAIAVLALAESAP